MLVDLSSLLVTGTSFQNNTYKIMNNNDEQIRIYELVKFVVNKFSSKLNLDNDIDDIIQDLYIILHDYPPEKITEQYIYKILYYQVVNKYNSIYKNYFRDRKICHCKKIFIMNMIMINLLLITLSCVIIIDCTDFTDNIKDFIIRMIFGKQFHYDGIIKPFQCSLCMTVWIGLTYLIIIGQLTILTFFLTLLLAVMTPVFYSLIMTIRELLLKLIKKTNNGK